MVNSSGISEFMRQNLEDSKDVILCYYVSVYLSTFDELNQKDIENLGKCIDFNMDNGNFLPYTCNPKYHKELTSKTEGCENILQYYVAIAFIQNKII